MVQLQYHHQPTLLWRTGFNMGSYKFGKPDSEIDLEDFKTRLNQTKLSLRKKAYAILLYWMGCRRSEPLVIKKEDIEEREGSLFISIHYRKNENNEPILFSRAKRGQAGGPTEIPLQLFGVDLVKTVWQKTKQGRKLFPFSDKTGYRVIKQLYPKKTPHWLRYNRITKLRKMLGDKLTIDDIKSFTGIRRDATVQDYGLKTRAGIHKISKVLE